VLFISQKQDLIFVLPVTCFVRDIGERSLGHFFFLFIFFRSYSAKHWPWFS